MFAFVSFHLVTDLVNGTAQTINVFAGRFVFPESAQFSFASDRTRENVECLVLELSYDENELDLRDRNFVSLGRSVALLRIEDVSVGEL